MTEGELNPGIVRQIHSPSSRGGSVVNILRGVLKGEAELHSVQIDSAAIGSTDS
jgi:hypothetical protein